MEKVLLIGGGKIGRMIPCFLADGGDYAVTVADTSEEGLKGFAQRGFQVVVLDAADSEQLAASVQDFHLGVGALPKYPTNALKYNLTWSTDRPINEYLNSCETIINGEYRQTTALEGREHFSLAGAKYEDFNTSGGRGALHETLAGKVRNLNYRAVRYPGHLDVIRLLLDDLKLRDLLVAGKIPDRGFVRQEDVRLDDFLSNRFGRYFIGADVTADAP
ncbi:MAG: saccharopine dehydrogenase NADP-binding domain-containing protein [Rhodospirillales bacterium]|nr:saccharopine dehydrogenase NADP-binding domain-containing protein [Rhodospirillales bacterium]